MSTSDPQSEIMFQWDVRIPMSDGISLSALLYLPHRETPPAPVIFALTPYTAQSLHHQGLYFAGAGFPFLVTDMRGRGNSDGRFDPCGDHGSDGRDICDWIAKQDFCDGQVAMWGGSIAGHVQWLTAARAPAGLAAIAPAASPFRGLDTPMRNNIFGTHRIQWLNLIAGRTSQERIFSDDGFWSRRAREWHESGESFRTLDTFQGMPSATWQEWMDNPHQGPYWDRQNPTEDQYRAIACPVLTITGIFDANQPGAIEHFRRHNAFAPGVAQLHHLVIGPWDHAGTRSPSPAVGGLEIGPSGLLDLQALHAQWYDWVLRNGDKPALLQKRIAYYVLGAETWRYADSLDEIGTNPTPLFLSVGDEADALFEPGQLLESEPHASGTAAYIYDPCDLTDAPLEQEIGRGNLTDTRWFEARHGKQLVFETSTFAHEIEIAGFFELEAWIALDQPDTDFEVSIHAVAPDGRAIRLTHDVMRARYRASKRIPRLIDGPGPQRFRFDGFMFTAFRLELSWRLRMVIGPNSSIFSQRNFNAAGRVADQTRADARPVKVELHCSSDYRSVLRVPFRREPPAPRG